MRETPNKGSLLVCVTGASGSIYARQFLLAALDHFSPVNLVVSRHGAEVVEHELAVRIDLDRLNLGGFLGEAEGRVNLYAPEDLQAAFASGSAVCDVTVIVPCSMGTAGRIASGASTDLITRAADVALKEGNKLILVPRETPLSLVHLRNLTSLAEAGAIVLPASPGFYGRPKAVADLVDFVVGRILLRAGISTPALQRWGAELAEAE